MNSGCSTYIAGNLPAMAACFNRSRMPAGAPPRSIGGCIQIQTRRDVFGWKHVDAGDGWLIFALPPAELGVHPAEEPSDDSSVQHKLSLLCDELDVTIRELRAKGIDVQGEPSDHGYGITVMLTLPGGVEVQLYEPRHPVAIAADGG